MTDDRAILADFADYRPIKTRKVLQIIVEVPLEQQAEVFAKLGYPMPDSNVPVALARIDALAASDYRAQKQRSTISVVGKEQYRSADDMTRARTRAVLLAKDPVFQTWANSRSNYLDVHDEDTAAEYVRERCGVASRSVIATEKHAYDAFMAMEAAYLADTNQMAERRA